MPQPTHRHLPSTTAARQAASMQTRPPETRPRTSPHGSAVPCTTHSIAGVRNAPKATRPLAVTPEIASGPIAKNRLSPGAHQPSMVDSSTPLSQRAKCVRASVREFGSRYTGSHPGRLGAARRARREINQTMKPRTAQTGGVVAERELEATAASTTLAPGIVTVAPSTSSWASSTWADLAHRSVQRTLAMTSRSTPRATARCTG